MDCSLCKATNSEDNRFCGQCGQVLDRANQALRQQILAILRQELKSEDLVSVEIADKVEDRLWRAGKVLGAAASLAAVALGIFGVTSLEKARARIEATAGEASASLSSSARDGKRAIETKSSLTLSQIQGQEDQTNAALIDLSTRTQSSSRVLAETEQALSNEHVRVALLAKIRESNPDTPIGDIKSELLTGYNPYRIGMQGAMGAVAPNIAAQQLALYNSVGLSEPGYGITSQPKTIATFSKGTVSFGVLDIQIRLKALGCYSPQVSGTFDEMTEAAVKEFEKRNSNDPAAPVSENDDRNSRGPTAAMDETPPGSVDRTIWNNIFSPSAKKCK